MRDVIRIFNFLLIVVLATTLVMGQEKPIQAVTTVAMCDLARHPQKYLNKLVRVRAIYRVGFEWQELYSIHCADAPSMWLEFSENFDESSSRKAMKEMELGNRFSITVGVVLEGMIIGYGGGYGHLNGYTIAFKADRVESAKLLDRNGVHRYALSPENRKLIEEYENSASSKMSLERTHRE